MITVKSNKANIRKIERKKAETKKRVAAYCRVRTDSDAQLGSLENQLEAFRYVHGELPANILRDMIRRGVKQPAGDCWKRLQLDRMLRNEKYAGDVVLQKTYIANHLSHKQVRNHGELPKFQITDAHPAIVDRHIFEQAQKIAAMRQVKYYYYAVQSMAAKSYCSHRR